MLEDQESMHTELVSQEERKYQTIGLTPDKYEQALAALERKDTETLLNLAQKSQKVITANEAAYPPSTKSRFFLLDAGYYEPSRGKLHERLVAEALAGKSPAKHPTITILAGPPGVGKSHFKHYMTERTAVETDPDRLKAALCPEYDGLNPEHVAATHEESLDIAQMILDASIQKGLDVMCESTFRAPDWVRGVIAKAGESDYQTEAIFLHKDLARCFRDAFQRSERPVSLSFLLSSIKGYDTFRTLRDEGAFTKVRLIAMNGSEPQDKSNDEEYAQNMYESLEVFRPLLTKL